MFHVEHFKGVLYLKKILTVLIACIILSSCKADNASKFVKIDEVSNLVFNKGYGAEEVLEMVKGVYYEDIAAEWGARSGVLSGFWGDIWSINDGENRKRIIVYYNSSGFAEHVIIDDIEEKITNNVNYTDDDPPLYYMDDNFFELLNNGEYSSDEVLRMLSSIKYSELHEFWGEPDGGEVTCAWGDVWNIGNNKQIIVFYNSIGFVENVIICNI